MLETTWAYHHAAGTRMGHRSTNQDRYLTSGRTVAVADGVGGSAHGDLAAGAAIAAVAQAAVDLEYCNAPPTFGTLEEVFEEAHRRVSVTAHHLPPGPPPMTTLTLLHLAVDDDAHLAAQVAWVGDSPAWVVHADSVEQVTQPHVTAAGDAHPGRLVRALGIAQSHEASTVALASTGPIRFVLATDGLLEVPAHRLSRELSYAGDTPREAVARLLAAAEESGALDNTTLVVVDAHPIGQVTPSEATSAI